MVVNKLYYYLNILELNLTKQSSNWHDYSFN